MTIKSFLSELFYKKNMKNIMIFLIALIGLMLIFGNNNLVLSEGLTLQEQQANMQRTNNIAALKNNQYKNLENIYNNDTFSNIEPFDQNINCGGENYASLGTNNANDVVHKACTTAKNTGAQRERQQ